MLNLSALLPRPARHASALFRLFACLLAPVLLNGCAALAVSLAGAGAGAGISHQMNGTASRTFSEPFDKVDNAARLAAKKMFLQIDEVATIENGQVTKARVSDLDVTIELDTLSPSLTQVNVVARKDLFRVDGATAQEIVVQIEHAIGDINVAEAAEAAEAATLASAKKSGKIDETRFNKNAPVSPTPSRKSSAAAKRKNTI